MKYRMAQVKARLPDSTKQRMVEICNALGLSEAEYTRGAIAARIRRDTRKINKGN